MAKTGIGGGSPPLTSDFCCLESTWISCDILSGLEGKVGLHLRLSVKVLTQYWVISHRIVTASREQLRAMKAWVEYNTNWLRQMAIIW